jgi:tetratricopeptide (TPR) repeat protein
MWSSIAGPRGNRLDTVHWHYLARVELVKLAVRRGEPRHAVDNAEKLLRSPPVDAVQAEAAVILGQLAQHEGHTDKAREFYARGIALLDQLDPPAGYPELTDQQEPLRSLLRALMRELDDLARRRQEAEQRAKAAAEAEKLLPPHVRAGNAKLHRARKLAEHQQFAAAAGLLRQFVYSRRDHPQHAEGRYLLGRFLIAAGQRRRALDEWEKLVGERVDSGHALMALRDMADVALFAQFDPDAAKGRLDRLLNAIHASVAPQSPPDAGPPAVPEVAQWQKLDAGVQATYHGALQRLALLAYLAGDEPAGEALLDRAARLPRPDALAELDSRYHDAIQSASDQMDQLLDIIRSQRLTNANGGRPLPLGNTADPRVGVAIMLGELHFNARDFKRSRAIFHEIIKPASQLKPTPEQEAYALLRAGLSCFAQGRYELAAGYFLHVASDRVRLKTPWAGPCLMHAATIAYSAFGDADRALDLFNTVATHYPDTKEARTALYFIGVIHQWSGRPRQARQAYQAVLDRYGDHPGVQLAVAQRMAELDPQPQTRRSQR